MHVVYVSNDAYARHLAVSAASLYDRNRDEEELQVWVLSAGISPESRKKLEQIAGAYGREIQVLELGEIRDRFDYDVDTGGFDISTMGRLFIGQILPETVKRVLYLDCDTVVSGSLKPLWTAPLQGHVLAAVMEPTIYETVKQEIGLGPEEPYFNAGVLLVDLEAWRREDVQGQLLRFYREKGGKLFACDQDAINGVLKGRILPLPPRYNFFTNYRYYRYGDLLRHAPWYEAVTAEAFRTAKRHPAILHFCGDERPWIAGNLGHYRKIYESYLARTPWAGTPKETGKELYMLLYHLMDYVTAVCPAARWEISRRFGMGVIENRKQKAEAEKEPASAGPAPGKAEADAAVLLAAYNGAAYIRQQLDSILSQSAGPLRILISDDGSSDGTAEILEEYRKRYPDRIFLAPRPHGKMGLVPGAAGNFFWLMEQGLQLQPKARYFFFCDQDDVWKKDKAEKLLKALGSMEAQYGEETPLLDPSEAMEIAGELKELFALGESPGEILNAVSRWKTGEEADEGGAALLEAYSRKLKERNALDFDDLLLRALSLAQSSKEEEGRRRFSYLCVDEFQDISPLQYQLLMAWNRNGKELFVIGDPDQAIYGFRGSDGKCFQRLKEGNTSVEEIHLEENYRSGEGILKLAEAVIEKNPGERGSLHPNRNASRPVRLALAENERGEAVFIAREINRLAGGIGMLEASGNAGSRDVTEIRSFGEIAVLYRTHQEARILESCLRKEGIPYVTAGRESFLAEEKVQGTLAFFRSLLYRRKEDREICRKLLWKLEEDAIAGEIYENTAETYRPLMKDPPEQILDRWIIDWNWQKREEMVKLEHMAVFYHSMEEMLEALLLGVESDLKRCGQKKYHADAVTLMTLHGSKGLEFPAVIVYGARKGQIPFESSRHQADPEEERRLFYVGLTRAKEELILTASGEVSPFLEELPEGLLERETAGLPEKAEAGHQMSLFEIEGFLQ